MKKFVFLLLVLPVIIFAEDQHTSTEYANYGVNDLYITLSTNDARKEYIYGTKALLKTINTLREANGADKLEWDLDLYGTAMIAGINSLSNNAFSHIVVFPWTGYTYNVRDRYNYIYKHTYGEKREDWFSIGENIHLLSYSSDELDDLSETIDDRHIEFLNSSPPHYENAINPKWDKIGIGLTIKYYEEDTYITNYDSDYRFKKTIFTPAGYYRVLVTCVFLAE